MNNKKIIAILTSLLLTFLTNNSYADCACKCIAGYVEPVCDGLYDIEPVCPSTKCHY